MADGAIDRLREILSSTSVPALLIEPPSEEIVAANGAAVRLLANHPGDQVAGQQIGQYFLGHMSGGLDLIAQGTVSAYETRRRTRSRNEDVRVWVRRLSGSARRPMAVILLAPRTAEPGAGTLPWDGVVAIGSVDKNLVVEHITAGIADLLGQSSEQLIGTSLLQLVDPADVGQLMEAS